MVRILIIAACLCGFGALLFAQTHNTPAPQQTAQTQQDRNNPFEAVPCPACDEPQQAVGPNIIEGVEFYGARRIPQDTLRDIIFSKVGDVYKQETLRLDVAVLRKTDRFEDVRVSTEEGKRGGIALRFVVIERPPIQ